MSTWGPIIGYSVIGCIAMGVQDFVNTYYTRFVNIGRSWEAGAMNGIFDLMSFVILSFSGVSLVTKYGWRGWIGTIPIIIVAVIVTAVSSKMAHDIEDEDEVAEDDQRDDLLESLQRRLESLERAASLQVDPSYTEKRLANLEGQK